MLPWNSCAGVPTQQMLQEQSVSYLLIPGQCTVVSENSLQNKTLRPASFNLTALFRLPIKRATHSTLLSLAWQLLFVLYVTGCGGPWEQGYILLWQYIKKSPLEASSVLLGPKKQRFLNKRRHWDWLSESQHWWRSKTTSSEPRCKESTRKWNMEHRSALIKPSQQSVSLVPSPPLQLSTLTTHSSSEIAVVEDWTRLLHIVIYYCTHLAIWQSFVGLQLRRIDSPVASAREGSTWFSHELSSLT